MNRFLLFFLTLLGAARLSAADAKVVAAPAGAPAAKLPAAAPRDDSAVTPTAAFDAFAVIGDRNIFNPNRTGRRERSTTERLPRVDTITLVGTMNYEKGLFAFFDSSDPAYRKALHVGDSVAVFKVTAIAANSVALERDGKPVTLAVGQQFRRPEGGDWTLVGEDIARAEAAAAAKAASAAAVDPTAAPVIPADADDVVKKMMERRQKELKQ